MQTEKEREREKVPLRIINGLSDCQTDRVRQLGPYVLQRKSKIKQSISLDLTLAKTKLAHWRRIVINDLAHVFDLAFHFSHPSPPPASLVHFNGILFGYTRSAFRAVRK